MRSRLFFVFALGVSGFGCGARVGGGAGAVGVADDALGVCAAGEVVHGIDVSHYDGTIDWAMVKASGIDFAFMKATEGTTFVDPDLAANWKGAGDAGVIRGAYHFLRPADDAVAQADFFVATAGVPGKGDLPLALDLETTDNMPNATVASVTAAFLARVQEQTGRAPVVYTSARFWGTFAGPSTGYDQYALWDAQWTTACPSLPPAWANWTFWQNAATGTVPGISGTMNVDLDQFNGSLAALQGWVDGSDADGGSDGGAVDGGAGSDGGGADGGATIDAHHGGCSFAAGGLGGDGRGDDGALAGGLVLAVLAMARAGRRRWRTATASAR